MFLLQCRQESPIGRVM